MELLEKARQEGEPPTAKDAKLNSFFNKLKEASDVIKVPTNKTNAHLLVNLDDYNRWVANNLKEAAIKIRRADIVQLHQEAMSYAESLKATLNTGEYGYLIEGLNSKAIPKPQLLIKDHKEKIDNEFLTRLVIPATNFAATFLKLGYLGIKRIFDDNNINYAKYTITQASDVKSKLEKLKIKQNQGTIMSMDIVNMYPSCKLKLIKQTFCYYAHNLLRKDKKNN
eukprot:13215950-Ditylum_brightwellii.AAC.1